MIASERSDIEKESIFLESERAVARGAATTSNPKETGYA